jgi:hypothetical protein
MLCTQANPPRGAPQWRRCVWRGDVRAHLYTHTPYLNNHKEFKPAALDASVIGLILCYDGKIVGGYGYLYPPMRRLQATREELASLSSSCC